MRIQHLVNLSHHNTFGFPVIAEECTTVESEEDALKLHSTGFFSLPHRILGGGSNVLFTTNAIPKVLINRIEGINILEESDESIRIQFGAGMTWHTVVEHAVNNGWGGIENLSLIPGSIGAAPIQNIGAYGVELKDTFHSLTALNFETGEINQFSHSECKFGYRDSIFKRSHKGKYLITSVTLVLQKKPTINTQYGDIQQVLNQKNISQPSIKDVSEAVIEIRTSKLPNPKLIGNAGSFFKNPVVPNTLYQELSTKYSDIRGYSIDSEHTKVPAGWLIEKAGWKGFRDGSIGVHSKQALVLVHYGGGIGGNVKSLAETIQKDIREKFGITLEFEVNIW